MQLCQTSGSIDIAFNDLNNNTDCQSNNVLFTTNLVTFLITSLSLIAVYSNVMHQGYLKSCSGSICLYQDRLWYKIENIIVIIKVHTVGENCQMPLSSSLTLTIRQNTSRRPISRPRSRQWPLDHTIRIVSILKRGCRY